MSEVGVLAAKSRFYRYDDGILLLVRKLTSPAPAWPDKPADALPASYATNLREPTHHCSCVHELRTHAILTPLATSVSLARFYARALLLVDWHGYLHTVVTSSLPTVPGANVFQTDSALAHPISPPAIRPWCRGERRLRRPSPCYSTRKLLGTSVHISVQPSCRGPSQAKAGRRDNRRSHWHCLCGIPG